MHFDSNLLPPCNLVDICHSLYSMISCNFIFWGLYFDMTIYIYIKLVSVLSCDQE